MALPPLQSREVRLGRSPARSRAWQYATARFEARYPLARFHCWCSSVTKPRSRGFLLDSPHQPCQYPLNCIKKYSKGNIMSKLTWLAVIVLLALISSVASAQENTRSARSSCRRDPMAKTMLLVLEGPTLSAQELIRARGVLNIDTLNDLSSEFVHEVYAVKLLFLESWFEKELSLCREAIDFYFAFSDWATRVSTYHLTGRLGALEEASDMLLETFNQWQDATD